MRPVLFACTFLLLGGCASERPHGPPPGFAGGPPPGDGPDGPGTRLFVSPMGEPFRGGTDGVAPADAWFRGADRDGDGQITLTEMILDGARFFRTLDVDGNGEIGPAEIDRYETEIVPETQTGATFEGGDGAGGGRKHGRGGPPGGGGMPGGGMGGGGMGGPPDGMGGGGGHGGGRGGPSGGGSGGPAGGGEPLRGAARFGYLALPEPVVAADANMNRAISPQEFQAAAQRRFALLDANHDGVLTQGELPQLRGAGGPRGRHGGRRPPAERIPVDPQP